MKTNDKTTNEETLTSIEAIALDDVTGGCAACGQTCANGPAPAAARTNKLGALAAAFSSFSRR